MAPQTTPFDEEEFWDDLLAFTEDRRVIPIVGSELLTIQEAGTSVPLYRAVAESLLNKYGLSAAPADNGIPLRKYHELNDAVSALAASGKRIKDLYRPIHDILQRLIDGQTEVVSALRQLASIPHFDLFATTTPDDLLARALDAVRFGGAAQTDQIEYAPALPTARRRDIPELRSPKYCAVFYLFGKADVSPFYAIHDEDALEFPFTLQYTVQNGVPPVRMFSELRSRNLLLIGCNFADWLSRFFLRLSNEKRLSSDERTKKEFLADETISGDGDLAVFLQYFSRDSRCYPITAAEFVAELYRRWQARNPPPPSNAPGEIEVSAGGSPAPSTGGIFISYSSDDIAAARQLYDQLQQIGGDVAWFDKSALKPGDDWNRQIVSAVQRCDLFLPLISTNTEHRTEGYFRLEWTEAAERSRRIQGRKFIFPIVTDPDYAGGMSRYALVPDAFKALQYSHAPGGQMSPDLRAEITANIRNLRRGRTV
jgi:hypothetical protein